MTQPYVLIHSLANGASQRLLQATARMKVCAANMSSSMQYNDQFQTDLKELGVRRDGPLLCHYRAAPFTKKMLRQNSASILMSKTLHSTFLG